MCEIGYHNQIPLCGKNTKHNLFDNSLIYLKMYKLTVFLPKLNFGISIQAFELFENDTTIGVASVLVIATRWDKRGEVERD